MSSNEGKKNSNLLLSPSKTSYFILMEAENEDKNFNIFIISNEGKMLPRSDPNKVHRELCQKVLHSSKISNLRCTRTGSLLLSTHAHGKSIA